MTGRPAPLPGIYYGEDGALHINLSEFLVGHGFADTEENRRMLMETAQRWADCHGAVYEEYRTRPGPRRG